MGSEEGEATARMSWAPLLGNKLMVALTLWPHHNKFAFKKIFKKKIFQMNIEHGKEAWSSSSSRSASTSKDY